MQDYNTIIGSIQMRLNGCQTRSVMDRYKIGSGTLNLIMSRYHANGIPIEELRMMAPKEVENLFYPQKNLQRKDVPLPDFQYYYDRIHAPGSRMNISFCWLDYKEKNPDGYEKSQFYEYFNRFIAENYGGQKVSMAVNRIPGEKMYIDWVGDQPELLTDTETGEIKKVHIFATTLGVSSLIYAEAFPNEKLPCFIEGCAHAVSFYGAVTKYFVPDNLRTAVTKHTMLMFEQMIEDWFTEEDSAYGNFKDALLAGDLDYMNQFMNQVALQTFSSFDTGGKPSEELEPERFYHGFVLGLIVDLAGKYRITSNRESGFGRYDVVMEPLKENLDAIVMEFKVQNTSKEKSLEETVEHALRQIQEKQYDTELIARGITKERIRHYGFAFRGRKC